MIGLFLWVKPGSAQFEGYNHPELYWQTIETRHFFIHFHLGEERSARLVAKIAEEVYKPITSLYHYEPREKVHIIIRDHDDYSGGAAFYYEDKIEIWATGMDFDLRGTHNWLRNVVTHEFTHIISLQAAQKSSRIPAFYLQYINYEREKRPDVLYGYPNAILSYPIAGTIVPLWFAEGLAQYQAPQLEHDSWDSHRDMILRMATLDDKLLSYNEMCVFGKNSLGNEMVYNQGYSLVSYIVEKFGPESLRRICRRMSSPFRYSFDSALKSVTGKTGRRLYEEWKSILKREYGRKAEKIRSELVQGKILENKGIGNFYPVWSPDEKMIAYISNKGADYLSQTSLWVYSFTTRKAKLIAKGVTSSVSWSPDGKKLVYSKRKRANRYGSHFYDIWIYDLKRNKEQRITHSLRAKNPDWSPDGKNLAFVITRDGTDNLAVMNLRTKKIKIITDFKDGRQIYHPRWSPNGKVIVFASSLGKGRDIALISPTRRRLKFIVTAYDSRNPVFSRDGKKIYFSWDRTGIFNIYCLNLYTLRAKQLTNVLGGAFMPSVNSRGDLVYSLYTSKGYKIAFLSNPLKLRRVKNLASVKVTRNAKPKSQATSIPIYKATPYKNIYTPLLFFPRVMVDYGRPKFGTYFYSSDILNRYSLLGGVAVNTLWDCDAFGIFQYRRLWPTLFLEVYNQVRHTEEEGVKYRYNLIELDVGFDLKLTDHHNIRASFVLSRYSGRLKTTVEDPISGQQEVTQGYVYFKGKDFRLEWNYRNIPRATDCYINPSGREVSLRLDWELNKFIDLEKPFTISPEYGTLVERYNDYNYGKITFDWREHLRLPWGRHTLGLRLRGGIIDRPVYSFFNFFAGGLPGMKGYPYYSIEGRKMALATVIYRFPILRHLGLSLLNLHFDKFYGAIYYDYGNAWAEDKVDFDKFKSDVGFQLRLETFSFYNYPLRIFFDVAYGLDQFSWAGQWYGKTPRYYFGLTFGFLD